jgi:hypothetical protein
MKPLARSMTLALAVALGATGCFSVQHTLPPNAYFGTLPRGASAEGGTPFEAQAHKNWGLAGLLPYSRWATPDLLAAQANLSNGKSVQIREIETIFDPFDVFISIVPGAFYGYYIWAPRSIHIVGVERPAETR